MSASRICFLASPSLVAQTLVATTARSLRPIRHSASTCSEWPYIGDESNRLAPPAKASSTTCRDAALSAAEVTLNVFHVPSPTAPHLIEVLPKARVSTEAQPRG